MGERSFYLHFRSFKGKFYALDKQSWMNCWSTQTGQLLWRRELGENQDFRGWDVDRQVYDRGWFPYALISKNQQRLGGEIGDAFVYKTFKIIEIDEYGGVKERLTFEHGVQRNMEVHLYFNNNFTMMLELILSKDKKHRPTYNLFRRENVLSDRW
mmetsp:Transcript_21895/g.16218  ORF Transcript_21895/g.16218 Transcript_21895/m.16218 type:complete len:155 (+) Transcript_21895:60-524(+)